MLASWQILYGYWIVCSFLPQPDDADQEPEQESRCATEEGIFNFDIIDVAAPKWADNAAQTCERAVQSHHCALMFAGEVGNVRVQRRTDQSQCKDEEPECQ